MLERFVGEAGRRLRVEAFLAQKLVLGNQALADAMADRCEMLAVKTGEALIEQGADDNDIYFIFAGVLDVCVNGRAIAKRGPQDHVGEMAAIQPAQRRSATVIAAEDCIVARLTEAHFSELGDLFPRIYRSIAQALSARLLSRNAFVGSYREKIRLFIISSAEALPVARALENAFEHDDFNVVLWTNGVFRTAQYPLESLEAELDRADFAVAVTHADDQTVSRGTDWPAPRDNVIFELGLFMGKLGRLRAILLEPREAKVKLPSDMAGVTTIPYRFDDGEDAAHLFAPACNKLRDHIRRLGPNNG